MNELKVAFPNSALVIPNAKIIKHNDTVTQLHAISIRLINQMDLGQAIWVFDDVFHAMRAVTLLQELNARLEEADEVPYMWTVMENDRPGAVLIAYGMGWVDS